MCIRDSVIIDYGSVCNTAAPWSGCSQSMGSPAYHDSLVVAGNFESMKSSDWWAFGQILSILLVDAVLYNEKTRKYKNLRERDLFIKDVPDVLHNIVLYLTRTDIPQSRRPSGRAIIDALFKVTEKF